MKSARHLRHLAIPFGIAVLVYVILYLGIEHRRTRLGPWEVAFTNEVSGVAAMVINQRSLGITNLHITFRGETNLIAGTVLTGLETPREVPYDVPFGQCVFMDATFMPGTLAFKLFGHEIQLLPRVLTIDRKEIPWRANDIIALTPLPAGSGSVPGNVKP